MRPQASAYAERVATRMTRRASSIGIRYLLGLDLLTLTGFPSGPGYSSGMIEKASVDITLTERSLIPCCPPPAPSAGFDRLSSSSAAVRTPASCAARSEAVPSREMAAIVDAQLH